MEIQRFLQFFQVFDSFPGEGNIIAEQAYLNLFTKSDVIFSSDLSTRLISKDIIDLENNNISFNEQARIFFSSVYIIDNKIKQAVEPFNEAEIINFFLKTRNKQYWNLLGYGYDSLFLLILDKIYKFNLLTHVIGDHEVHSNVLQHSFFDIFPYLSYTNVDQLCNALIKITIGIKAEQNYLNLHDNIIKLSQQNILFGNRIIEFSFGKTDTDELFIPFAFLGLTKSKGFEQTFKIIHPLLESDNPHAIKLGLNCLQRLFHDDDHPEVLEVLLIQILEQIADYNNDELTASLILTYGALIDKFDASRTKLLELSVNQETAKQSRAALAFILSRQIKLEYNEAWFQQCLKRLSHLPGIEPGVVRNLSYGFTHVIDIYPHFFLQYIKDLIDDAETDLDNLRGFENTFALLLQHNPKLFQVWLTESFNNNEIRFQIAATKVLNGQHSLHEINFDSDLLQSLTPFDIEFIAIKIIGFLADEQQLLTAIYSLTLYRGAAYNDIGRIIVEIFNTFLVYNYPGAIEYLESKFETADEFQKELITRIKEYHDKMYKVKEEKPLELNPSPKRLKIFLDEFNNKYSGKPEDSPFRQPSFMDMITTLNIKMGKFFFMRDQVIEGLKDQYSEKSEMTKFSHSFTLPTGVMTDPVGEEFQRYNWRLFKKRSK